MSTPEITQNISHNNNNNNNNNNTLNYENRNNQERINRREYDEEDHEHENQEQLDSVRLTNDEPENEEQIDPKLFQSKFKRWRKQLIAIGLVSLLVLVILSLIVAYFVSYAKRDTTVHAAHGAVAADNAKCSNLGVDMLKRGGNSVDAAITTALCLGLRQPFASGIGGGGFMMIHLNNTNENVYVNLREKAPAAAHKTMYVNRTEDSKTGGLAVGVPGEIRGYHHAHRRYGVLPWKELFTPVINMAREGFHVDALLAEKIKDKKDKIESFPALRAVFRPNGEPYRTGDVMKRPKLADTLERIANEGPDAFYSGSIMKSMVKSIQEEGGILTADDFANYTIETGSASHSTYRGRHLYFVPPPSSGIVVSTALNIIAALLRRQNITDTQSLAALGPATHHVIVEALKHAFAHRMHLGDPDYVDVSWLLDRLQDDAYITELSDQINLDTTFPPDYYFINQSIATETDHGTSHLSVVDRHRNAVALTTTVNFSFGSGVMVPDTGILLNDQMNDFTVAPDQPNGFHLPPTPANFIEPGKRPLSSMSPTIMTSGAEEHFHLAIGGSGGPTIISATLESAINMLEFGLQPLAAVSAPRYHTQLIPDHVGCEATLSTTIRDALKERHHKLAKPTVLPDGHSVGVCQAVMMEMEGRELMAASDPRKKGRAAGY